MYGQRSSLKHLLFTRHLTRLQQALRIIRIWLLSGRLPSGRLLHRSIVFLVTEWWPCWGWHDVLAETWAVPVRSRATKVSAGGGASLGGLAGLGWAVLSAKGSTYGLLIEGFGGYIEVNPERREANRVLFIIAKVDKKLYGW